MNSALTVESLVAGYAGVPAVRGVSFSVELGEVLAILGPNGSGKSTTLLAIAGKVSPLSGKVMSFDANLTGLRVEQVAQRGVSLVPDSRGLFFGLTVREHVKLARKRRSSEADVGRVLEQFPVLGTMMNRRAGQMSGGEQQMLALAKALIPGPKVLLIDEMSLGLAPIVVRTLLPIVRELVREGRMAVVLVEQHIGLALEAADNALVLKHGDVRLRGDAETLRRSSAEVQAAYLG